MKHLLCLLLLLGISTAQAKEYESYYQQIFCGTKDGITEVVLEDGSRADCVTSTEAIEVDFAHKWAESIGQSLLYSELLGKQPAVLLIVNSKSSKYLTRFHNATKGLDIKLYIIDE